MLGHPDMEVDTAHLPGTHSNFASGAAWVGGVYGPIHVIFFGADTVAGTIGVLVVVKLGQCCCHRSYRIEKGNEANPNEHCRSRSQGSLPVRGVVYWVCYS